LTADAPFSRDCEPTDLAVHGIGLLSSHTEVARAADATAHPVQDLWL